MKLVSIRGAITIEENSSEAILKSTRELLTKMELENEIEQDQVISIIFTCTKDLNQVYPARAARAMGYVHAGLMCFNEMIVEGSLGKCLRIMIYCNSNRSQDSINHVYLKGAKVLRPDLII